MDAIPTAEQLWALQLRLRSTAPLVQNLSNLVVQSETAQAIAAIGGTQLTLHTPEEAAAVAGLADALVLNSGTLDSSWLGAADAALDVAHERGSPWLLDPVAAGLTPYRDTQLHRLLGRAPRVIKGNASEILTLAGIAKGGRGADSRHSVAEAAEAAQALARGQACVVVVSGARDYICDGQRAIHIANGHPLLGRMIGSGCMLGAILGCYLAVEPDAFLASVTAVATFAVAGELASERAAGPGSLKPELFDALYQLDATRLAARLRLQPARSASSTPTTSRGS